MESLEEPELNKNIKVREDQRTQRKEEKHDLPMDLGSVTVSPRLRILEL